MTYRVYVYWIDEPAGRIWQIDQGDQGPNGELADIFREVKLKGVSARTVVRPEPNRELLGRREPKAWLEVSGGVLEADGDVATIRREEEPAVGLATYVERLRSAESAAELTSASGTGSPSRR